ncbi:MAG: spiro-SPASM protein [Spirochaetaceae bacterium]|nr:spiro-SPASM protein [Spirochaetaceae bacterium]
MKNIVILFAGNTKNYAVSPLFNGQSACEAALKWACSVPNTDSVVLLTSDSTQEQISKYILPVEKLSFKHINKQIWTTSVLLQTLAEASKGYDAVVYGFADAPFYDSDITEQLLKNHTEYHAEYSFADGYPEGMAPEVVYPGTLQMMYELAKDNEEEVQRDTLFSVLKTDINAYEIETLIAPVDLRYLRLALFCDTKRNTLQCERIFKFMSENKVKDICSFVAKQSNILRTLPAYYSIQVVSSCAGSCSYCPYPQEYKKKTGKCVYESHEYMDTGKFKQLVKKISEFSEDAVICLSLWGEAENHPDFVDLVKTVLDYEDLSVLVETTGQNLSQPLVNRIAELAASCKKRKNGQKPVNWIVSLDAIDEAMYGKLHSGKLSVAVSSLETLLPLFPGAVYPQFVRLQDNEAQLESFYRFWKEKAGSVIIQKYDDFCGKLPQRKVADLAPVCRNPCWHLRRDLSVLVDGSVPFCREAVLDGIIGNAFDDSLESIWEKNEALFAEQVDNVYGGICENCDEYYTFNF